MDDDIILECSVTIRGRKCPYVYRISPAVITVFIVSYKYSNIHILRKNILRWCSDIVVHPAGSSAQL